LSSYCPNHTPAPQKNDCFSLSCISRVVTGASISCWNQSYTNILELSAGEALGHYELQPLNVLDPAAFKKIIARFPPGPIAIVNGGLLVYLDSGMSNIK
jgi:hypothetical protein